MFKSYASKITSFLIDNKEIEQEEIMKFINMGLRYLLHLF